MAALAQATIRRLDQIWATYLGCSESTLVAPHVHLLPHAGLGDYDGIFIFARGEGRVVSAPPAALSMLSTTLQRLSVTDLLEPTRLRVALGDRIARIIGPTFHGYADATTFRPQDTGDARLLGETDTVAFADLRAACDPEEWARVDSFLDQAPVIGVYAGATLAAAASYRVWQGEHATIAIVAHPDWRGRGYGRAAVGAVAERARAEGLLPGYRTLLSNHPSLALARVVGFVPYATSLSVPLAI
jgi:GNAT superfamily N-acetyltransferase